MISVFQINFIVSISQKLKFSFSHVKKTFEDLLLTELKHNDYQQQQHQQQQQQQQQQKSKNYKRKRRTNNQFNRSFPSSASLCRSGKFYFRKLF